MISIDVDYQIKVLEKSIDKDINEIESNIMESCLCDTYGINSYYVESENESIGSRIKNKLKDMIRKIKEFIMKCINTVKKFFSKKETEEKIKISQEVLKQRPEFRNIKIPVSTKLFDKTYANNLTKLNSIQKKVESGHDISDEEMYFLTNFDEICIDKTKKRTRSIAATAAFTAVSIASTFAIIKKCTTDLNKLNAEIDKIVVSDSMIDKIVGSSNKKSGEYTEPNKYTEPSDSTEVKIKMCKAKLLKDQAETLTKEIHRTTSLATGNKTDDEIINKIMGSNTKSIFDEYCKFCNMVGKKNTSNFREYIKNENYTSNN